MAIQIKVEPAKTICVYDVPCSTVVLVGGTRSKGKTEQLASLVRQRLCSLDPSYAEHNALTLDIDQIRAGEVDVRVTFLAIRAANETVAETKAKSNFEGLMQELMQTFQYHGFSPDSTS